MLNAAELSRAVSLTRAPPLSQVHGAGEADAHGGQQGAGALRWLELAVRLTRPAAALPATPPRSRALFSAAAARSQPATDPCHAKCRWDEWVDPSKLATGGSHPTPAQQLGAPPRTKARKAGSGAPGSSSATAALRTDTEEVRSLKGEVESLREANAALEERLTALELSGRKGGISVPPAALVASLQLLATAEAELGQDAEVARNLKAQGMTKTVKKKPGLNSAELMVEACLRFSTCMRAQAVENSKAQVALIDTQLQMAREQKAVRTQMVQMQQLIMQGFTTASGLAATAAAAAGPEPVSGNASPTRTATSVGSSVPDESATKIQAAFRGKKEREGLDQTIEQGLVAIESSAVEIQRMWRGKKQRDEIEKQFEAEVAALRQQHGEHPEDDEYAGASVFALRLLPAVNCK